MQYFGSKLKSGDGATVAASTTFTDLAKCRTIGGPDITVGDIEETNLDSADTATEYVPGLIEGGEVTFDMLFTKAQAATAYGLLRTQRGWRYVLSDGSKWEFNGYLKRFGTEGEIKGAIINNGTIKITGKPVYTAAP